MNRQYKVGDPALHMALWMNRWELVSALLEHEADVNTVNSKNQTPLHWAAWRGAPADIVPQLISPHNINIQCKDGNTALHTAVWMNRWELVPVLLQHGADVNLSDCRNRTPLHHAVYHDAPADIITQLISPHSIKIQATDGSTALHEAVWRSKWDLVSVLLQHGADVNLCHYRMHRTPLYYAAYQEAPADIITKLISAHNINMQDKEGTTALHQAANGRSWELVPVLLQNGADVNLVNSGKQTPLHWAALCGAPADIITQLISPHNINIQDTNGNTALHWAVSWKRWYLVPVLLQYGADPSLLDAPQPGKPLLLSLQAVCINTIRGHMPVKTDAAYAGLRLPLRLKDAAKLKPQAQAIEDKGRNE